jgi:Flp pilus assembly protein TadG
MILPLLILLVFGVMEFGAIMYVQMALQNGVSQATRFAITRNVIAGQTREQSIRTIMRQETPTLTIEDANFTFSNKPLNGGSWTNGTGGPGSIERVTVTYTWTILTPIIRPFFSEDTLTITVSSTMKNESELEL